MSRNICILLLAALFVFTQGSELQRFALNQGRVNLRSLAATDSIERVNLDKYNENFGVFVNLGEEYLSNNSLTLKNQTDMTVILHTNVTAFCRGCSEFVNYNCSVAGNSNTCNADLNVEQSFYTPFRSVRYANPVNHSISIGNTTTPSWKLSTNASVFSSFTDYNYYYYTSYEYSRNYFNNYSTYGLLGLGVGGEAASNFRGDHPLFSISMNSTGYGSLIFGKDSTLYDASKTPMNFTADTNWAMATKNLTFGNYTNTSFVSTLVFDLQHPGIALPQNYWSDSKNDGDFKTLFKKLKLNSTIEDGYYTYYGNLTDLPNLVFGLENGKNLTLPPAAYTRKSASRNDTYLILIGYVQPITNYSDPSNTNKVNHTVIGWSVLSQFYTIFEQKTGSEPTITLYPAKASGSSSDNSSNSTPTSFGTRAIQLAVVVVILAVVYTCFKNRAAAKLQNDLSEQLNRRPSAF